MNTFSTQLSSDRAIIRFDIIGGPARNRIVEDDTFLNYRLGSVQVSNVITKQQPDIVWYYDKEEKTIEYREGQLTLTGFWEEGELNKIMVTMLANEMDQCGLHPFHSSSVIYKTDDPIGWRTTGKSMCQLKFTLQRNIFSATTVTDNEGRAVRFEEPLHPQARKGTAQRCRSGSGRCKFSTRTRNADEL